jgi:hypothetical protein
VRRLLVHEQLPRCSAEPYRPQADSRSPPPDRGRLPYNQSLCPLFQSFCDRFLLTTVLIEDYIWAAARRSSPPPCRLVARFTSASPHPTSPYPQLRLYRWRHTQPLRDEPSQASCTACSIPMRSSPSCPLRCGRRDSRLRLAPRRIVA